MNRNVMLAAAAIAIAAGAGVALFPRPAAPPAVPPATPAFIDPADRAQVLRGKAIYASHCASCHGASLEGQPNWRERLPNGRLPAPPHDASGHTWHHPDTLLVDIVRHGLVPGRTAPEGYQSDMPAYASTLPDADIRAVLAYIKSHWPADALNAQREVSQQAE